MKQVPRTVAGLTAQIIAWFALSCLVLHPPGLLAQGPKPLGLHQPAPTVGTSVKSATNSAVSDTTHVRPNHWRRGARIGVAVTVIPLTIFALTEGCRDFPGSQARCAVAATGFIALTGVFGGLVGGFIGSFFPRSEPAPAASGAR